MRRPDVRRIRHCSRIVSDRRFEHYRSRRSSPMAKPNFNFQKRQKEIARQKKNEEKRQRKLEKNAPKPAEERAPSLEEVKAQ